MGPQRREKWDPSVARELVEELRLSSMSDELLPLVNRAADVLEAALWEIEQRGRD
jgi:hypothetical protein